MLIAPFTIFDDAGVEIKNARLPGYFSGFFYCVAVLVAHLLLALIPQTRPYLKDLLYIMRTYGSVYVLLVGVAFPAALFVNSLVRARQKHRPSFANVTVWLCLYLGGIGSFWVMAGAFASFFAKPQGL